MTEEIASTPWPEWVSGKRLPDKIFSRAYEAAPDDVRARMKKQIAQLYDIFGPGKVVAGENYQAWKQGFATWSRTGNLDRTLIILGGDFASPSMLLAAVLPAICAGADNILTVRAGRASDWPPLLLTALELAGRETAAALRAGEINKLLDALVEDGEPTAIIVLGGATLRKAVTAHLAESPQIRVFAPNVDLSVGILLDSEDDWDFEAMLTFLPDAAFYLTLAGMEGHECGVECGCGAHDHADAATGADEPDDGPEAETVSGVGDDSDDGADTAVDGETAADEDVDPDAEGEAGGSCACEKDGCECGSADELEEGDQEIELPEGFVVLDSGLAGLAESELDVLFAPTDYAAEGLFVAPLVLGPGQEGTFLWPELTPEFFLIRRTYIG